MVDFLKFMLKCIFSIGYQEYTGPHSDKLYMVLGCVGFIVFDLSLWIFGRFIVKVDSIQWRIIISVLISLVIVILYFFIAYCFVR